MNQTKIHVYCRGDGNLEFGPRCPGAAIPIGYGPEDRLRKVVSTLARHSYDGQSLVIPGVPEAENDNDVLAAMWAFSDQVQDQLLKPAQEACHA